MEHEFTHFVHANHLPIFSEVAQLYNCRILVRVAFAIPTAPARTYLASIRDIPAPRTLGFGPAPGCDEESVRSAR